MWNNVGLQQTYQSGGDLKEEDAKQNKTKQNKRNKTKTKQTKQNSSHYTFINMVDNGPQQCKPTSTASSCMVNWAASRSKAGVLSSSNMRRLKIGWKNKTIKKTTIIY
jgi:hypothetical protein